MDIRVRQIQSALLDTLTTRGDRYQAYWAMLADSERHAVTLDMTFILSRGTHQHARDRLRYLLDQKMDSVAKIENDFVEMPTGTAHDATACQNEWTFTERLMHRFGLTQIV